MINNFSKASQAANDYIQTYLEKNAKKIKTLVADKQKESVSKFGKNQIKYFNVF